MVGDVARSQGDPGGDLALVLSGGGARAAYQVGVLRALARRAPGLRFRIVTGVSAGAINAAFLAARAGALPDAVESLGRLWSELRVEQVFRVDPGFFVGNLLRWAARLVSGGTAVAPRTRSLVGTPRRCGSCSSGRSGAPAPYRRSAGTSRGEGCGRWRSRPSTTRRAGR